MPFSAKSGKFNACINTVEVGCGDKAIKIGGENVSAVLHLRCSHRERTEDWC